MQDVYQVRNTNKQISVYFTLENQKYRFLILKDDDELFKPFRLSPVHPVDFGNILTSEIDLDCLFHQLINHPSIRLEWLYIPHVEV